MLPLQRSCVAAAGWKVMHLVLASAQLRAFRLFDTLDDATLGVVAMRMRRVHYRPGEQIVREGEQTGGIFFVERGRVRLACTAADGREQVLAMLRPGASFNVIAAFDGQPNPATARAMSIVQCVVLPAEALRTLIYQYPGLGLAVLHDMAGQLRGLVVLVEDLAFRSVRERLARQLLQDADDGCAEATQQELAERAGTVREIAGRALRRLAEEGLVRLERGRVIVLDPARLRDVIAERTTRGRI
jgi:CRP/FNR family cyclic AMP-dependent transcriptional regulator